MRTFAHLLEAAPRATRAAASAGSAREKPPSGLAFGPVPGEILGLGVDEAVRARRAGRFPERQVGMPNVDDKHQPLRAAVIPGRVLERIVGYHTAAPRPCAPTPRRATRSRPEREPPDDSAAACSWDRDAGRCWSAAPAAKHMPSRLGRESRRSVRASRSSSGTARRLRGARCRALRTSPSATHRYARFVRSRRESLPRRVPRFPR